MLIKKYRDASEITADHFDALCPINLNATVDLTPGERLAELVLTALPVGWQLHRPARLRHPLPEDHRLPDRARVLAKHHHRRGGDTWRLMRNPSFR